INDWMLRHLQLFLLRDFYEYNAIPYQRYSSYALHNLADFANDTRVKRAARTVLDHLSAKFAVGSNQLRRYPPIRRHSAELDKVNLEKYFGANIDAQAARMAFIADMPERLDDASEPIQSPKDRDRLRFGHAHLSSLASLVTASLSNYRPPESIVDLVR